MSTSNRVAQDQKKRIDDLLASAIDQDQMVILRTERLCESIDDTADIESECGGIKDSAKKSVDLLNMAHELLNLDEAASDEGSDADA